MIIKSVPYWASFVLAFSIAYLLVPMCRRVAIALGMVDKPGPRRINKDPIPRAGGLALYLATAVVLAGIALSPLSTVVSDKLKLVFVGLGGLICVVGLLDDKFGLHPLVKLGGQVLVAILTYFCCNISFTDVFLSAAAPIWIDLPITVFWMVGAINAFNLIDGLDGLAAGLAAIAALGMASAMAVLGNTEAILPYLVFAGASIGFLRYNFNPASVFLGDTGSMFIGYFISVMPLLSDSAGNNAATHSLFVSLGVPLLAMGVPIFDTSLAIMRRSVRAILSRSHHGDEGQTNVMGADADHLHHRLLRSIGGQRGVAIVLYLGATALVLVGIGGIVLESRAAGLFLVAFIAAIVVAVKDMERIELWDFGRLIKDVVEQQKQKRYIKLKTRMLMSMPLWMMVDIVMMSLVIFFVRWLLRDVVDKALFRLDFLVFVVPPFVIMVLSGIYRIAWSRAQMLNVARLALSIFGGSVASIGIVVLSDLSVRHLAVMTLLFTLLSGTFLVGIRMARMLLKDLFYRLENKRLSYVPDGIERMIAYGGGARFRSFFRELVIASGNNRRVLVAIIDDDPVLKGRTISGLTVAGPLDSAADAIKEYRAETIVITCKLESEKRQTVINHFHSLGVRVIEWSCQEIEC